MKYYIIAGEPSGDLHGSNLIKGILAEDGEAQLRFWGGDLMAEAGGRENLVKHYRETSFFGIGQVLKNYSTIRRQMAECKKDIISYAPDVLILIDYPGFNMRIAEAMHKASIKVFYYIAPKVWAWREYRAKRIRKYVDRLYCIFPFEQSYFPKWGIEPVFCGNPLTDSIAQQRSSWRTKGEFCEANNLDNRPIVALLAGSRRSEIRDNLPDMVALSREFPSHTFVLAGVDWIEREYYDRYLAGSDVRFVCGKTYELLSVADAAVVTSGTATLETALIGTPEVVLYHTVWLYEKLRPYVLKVPYISLVNLNLDREAVKEIVRSKFDLGEAREELASILTGGSRRERMLADFDELREKMGGEGASLRFAKDMVKTLKQR